MKSPRFARLLVLTAALAITLTPGCKRKVAGPTTPLPPPRSGSGAAVGNPQPGGPTDPSTGGRSTTLAGNDGTKATDLTNTTTPPGNVPLDGAPLNRDAYTENRSQFASDTVYFDFDSSVIKSSEKSKITAIADHLKSNPTAAVEVEGHCDERGTEEYNRSLGERRALAVREELAQRGIDPKRVFTISFGEDRPAVNGHDEAAWSKNRRGESVLLTPR